MNTPPGVSDRRADLETALAHGRSLLAKDPAAAIEQAREILRISPQNGDALRLLGAALRRAGRAQEAERAEVDAIAASGRNPVLVEAARAITRQELAPAEHLLRPYLKLRPDDAAALRMLAEIAARTGALGEAEALLGRALKLAPAYESAQARLAAVLETLGRNREALALIDRMLARNPRDVARQAAKARILARIGDYQQAVDLYAELLKDGDKNAQLWLSYGHVLKTIGRREDSIAAYRRAIDLEPGFGEAWWSLANLKTLRLDADDLTRMTVALEQPDLDAKSRINLHFATAKLLEDARRDEESFRHYAEGNRLQREIVDYDPSALAAHVQTSERLFTRDFFEDRAGQGARAPDPIFILGMPRSGSTLVEQILASHSEVEGTSELPHLPVIAESLGFNDWLQATEAYPSSIANLGADELRALGELYLERAREHRRTARPFFIDKLPNNWAHIGLIRLILPKAKIIDARRDAMACCFSNFKQLYAHGQAFSYSLTDLGDHYRQYVRLLDHFDRSLPDPAYRVMHERMVQDPRAEIAALLDHLGLPFEEQCLRFHENPRAVRTASAEQVRRPIYRDAVDEWRRFESWLGPLKEALGEVAPAP